MFHGKKVTSKFVTREGLPLEVLIDRLSRDHVYGAAAQNAIRRAVQTGFASVGGLSLSIYCDTKKLTFAVSGDRVALPNTLAVVPDYRFNLMQQKLHEIQVTDLNNEV